MKFNVGQHTRVAAEKASKLGLGVFIMPDKIDQSMLGYIVKIAAGVNSVGRSLKFRRVCIWKSGYCGMCKGSSCCILLTIIPFRV